MSENEHTPDRHQRMQSIKVLQKCP